jgi:catechol 2,3-dioxygenase-like lactoylglutathione lyase family enzyme
MSVQLNHTIVSCRDQQRSAAFLSEILGLPPATRFGHFLVVEADNAVSLDFAESSGEIVAQHYAFLVGEDEFDARLRPHPGLGADVLGGSRQEPARGDQPQRRRPRPVLRRPRRSQVGDHHPPVRQRRLDRRRGNPGSSVLVGDQGSLDEGADLPLNQITRAWLSHSHRGGATAGRGRCGRRPRMGVARSCGTS